MGTARWKTPILDESAVSQLSCLAGVCGLVVWLALVSGCATVRSVNLDTGRGGAVVYTPIESDPITLNELEFKSAVARLVLEMNLDISFSPPFGGNSRSWLASSGGLVDGVRGHLDLRSEERLCQAQIDPESCLNLLSNGLTLGSAERHMMALSFAIDTVWDGVEEVVGDLANPEALRMMVVSAIGASLLMLVAPEPITKLLAMALTASLIAYLGTGPVWSLGQGFLRLLEESRSARGLLELERAGHRFGKVLGANGVRVLVLVALTTLGGPQAMAAQRPMLPNAVQAALRAQTEGGFQLSAVLTGGVQSIALPSAGVLNVVLAPTAVAAIAMGPGGIQGDPEGDVHHICTDKNEVSEASGGPWTPLYEPYFNRARMTLNDPANLVRINGHRGPHPREYHQQVLDRIDKAMRGCRGVAQCRTALVEELARIARELTREGMQLRKLIMKDSKG